MDDALRQACARAIHVIRTDGAVLRAGRAALAVLAGLGFRRTAAILRLPPLVWGVELGYRVVARNRRFFARFLFRPRG